MLLLLLLRPENKNKKKIIYSAVGIDKNRFEATGQQAEMGPYKMLKWIVVFFFDGLTDGFS